MVDGSGAEKHRRTTRLWDWLSFSVFVLLMLLAQYFHERWFDEYQAWFIAADSHGLVDLLTTRVAYEGTPGLWHLLLYLPAKMGMAPTTLTLISGTLATLAVALLLFFSPFPDWLRPLLPFTFFIGYQYSVVSRSYVLDLLGVCVAAWAFERRLEKPWPYHLSLFVLANSNGHGFIIALGLLGADGLELLRTKKVGLSQILSSSYGPFLKWSWISGLGLVLAFLQVYPTPADCTFARGGVDLVRGITAIEQAFLGSFTLSLLFITISVVWFVKRRVAHYFLIPTLGLMILFIGRYVNFWHAGQIFLCWLFTAWISLLPGAKEEEEGLVGTRKGFLVATLLVVVGSITQTGTALWHDYEGSYSGAEAAGAYLKAHNLDKGQVYVWSPATTAVLGSFDHNIFGNYPPGSPRYFFWSTQNPGQKSPTDIIIAHPEYLLVSLKTPMDDKAVRFLVDTQGYQVEQFFPGALFWRYTSRETDGFLLLKRVGPAMPLPPARPSGEGVRR